MSDIQIIPVPLVERGYIDLMSNFLIAATLFNVIPSIAALLSIVWFCLCIWESRTVQKLWDRWSPTPVSAVTVAATTPVIVLTVPQKAEISA